MKKLEIENLEDKNELNTDAFISLGIGSKSAIKHVKMRNMPSMKSDWISASESLLE